jgi:hypothetical protein
MHAHNFAKGETPRLHQLPGTSEEVSTINAVLEDRLRAHFAPLNPTKRYEEAMKWLGSKHSGGDGEEFARCMMVWVLWQFFWNHDFWSSR